MQESIKSQKSCKNYKFNLRYVQDYFGERKKKLFLLILTKTTGCVMPLGQPTFQNLIQRMDFLCLITFQYPKNMFQFSQEFGSVVMKRKKKLVSKRTRFKM